MTRPVIAFRLLSPCNRCKAAPHNSGCAEAPAVRRAGKCKAVLISNALAGMPPSARLHPAPPAFPEAYRKKRATTVCLLGYPAGNAPHCPGRSPGKSGGCSAAGNLPAPSQGRTAAGFPPAQYTPGPYRDGTDAYASPFRTAYPAGTSRWNPDGRYRTSR